MHAYKEFLKGAGFVTFRPNVWIFDDLALQTQSLCLCIFIPALQFGSYMGDLFLKIRCERQIKELLSLSLSSYVCVSLTMCVCVHIYVKELSSKYIYELE